MRLGLRLAVMAAVLLVVGVVTGCSSDDGKKDDVQDTKQDLAGDLAGDAVVPGDVVPDQSGPDYSAWCPILPPGTLPVSTVVPAPRMVYLWGESQALSKSTYVAKGVPSADQDEFDAIMAERGLTAAADDAGIEFHFFGPADFALLQAQCSLPESKLPGAHYIRLLKDEAGDGMQAQVFFADSDGGFYALKTLRQLLGNGTATQAVLYDYPFSPLRGVLEGFYGDPWPKEDRMGMMREIANLKYNLFVYGAKMDGYVNIGWTQPYPASELKYIDQLLAEAKKQHLQVCWEIHGGWPITFSSEKDMELILQKFGDVADRGVSCFLIGFDDLNKLMTQKDAAIYDTYPNALADFVKRLGDQMKAKWPDALLVFVPHEYYTKDPGTTTDLVTVVSQIQDFWYVAWTGPDVLSRTVYGTDIDEITEIIGRTPILGDNYPVNDYFTLFNGDSYLHLAPITGRDKALLEKAPAVCFNTSPEAWASLPPLATIADFVWNPDGYTPDGSASNVALYYAGAAGKEAMELMMQTNYSPLLSPNSAPGLAEKIALFWAAWDDDDVPALEAAATALNDAYFTPFAQIAEKLAAAPEMHPSILLQIQAHVDATAQYGVQCPLMLDLLVAKKKGTAPEAGALAALQAAYDQLNVLEGPRPTGYVTLDFMAKGIAFLGDQPLPTPHEMQ